MGVEVAVCPQGGFNPSVNEHPGAAQPLPAGDRMGLGHISAS